MKLWTALILIMCADWSLQKFDGGPTYTNKWTVKIEGGEEVAKRIARQLGYSYKGQMGQLEDYYMLVKNEHPEVSKRRSEHLTRSLLDLDEVKWANQQKLSKKVFHGTNNRIEEQEEELIKYMKKEAKIIANSPSGAKCQNIFSCIRFPFSFRRLFRRLRQGNISNLGMFSTRPAPHSQLSMYKGPTKNIQLLSRKISAYEIYFKDPLWTKQWHAQDYRTTDMPVMDHNLVPVYKMGFTGKGVTVAIVDTVIQVDHPDLKDNIDVEKSYDLCQDKPLALVQHGMKVDETHGTNSAGVVAMMANNDKCGVGVAFNAKIAAIRNDCQDETEDDFGRYVLQNYMMIDISSNSWGPGYEYTYVMNEYVLNCYKKGATEGREGKGVVYVQGAGNFAFKGVTCATKGNLNHPYVITITSANQYGKRSDYSEKCAAVFASTYTGTSFKYLGKRLERTITLTKGGKCDDDYCGTSASTPIAAGIIALTLEANSELTYRDVMHIIARSAEVAPLADNDSWKRNGQGFWVSDEFGFGLMNAENMVILAKTWITVPEKHTCIVSVKLENPESVVLDKMASISFDTEACQSSLTDSVFYLEHLELASIIEYPKIAAIQINITSPSGTESLLLNSRSGSIDTTELNGWAIMSVQNWGENPKGKWLIEVALDKWLANEEDTCLVKEFTIKFHGIGKIPTYLEKKRVYGAFRLPSGITEDGSKG